MELPVEGGRQPPSRQYRLLMEKAIAAKNLGDINLYSTLLHEADRMLQHIRTSSALQAEGQDAQLTLEQDSQYR